MSAPEPPVPLRPLELRRGTKAVTELFADGRRIAVSRDGRVNSELRRNDVNEQRYRWQAEVSGP